MRTSVIALITIFLFATMFVSESNAQGRMGKRQGMRTGQNCTKMFTALNLTDTQKDKITSLRESHQKAMIDLRAQVQKDMLDLKELKTNENPSRNDVLSAVEKLNKSKDAMALARANHQMDVREVLTLEQRKTFKEFQGQMMGKHRKGMRGNGMGNGYRGRCNF